MNVRTASFRDLARIEQLYRDAIAADDQGARLTADSPVPQATLVRLWYSLSKTLSSLMPIAEGDTLYVAEDGSDVVGFIQAQSVAGKPKAWQILNLCTATGGPGHFSRERLLLDLTRRGQEAGVHRFYVRLPLEHPLVSVFLEQGFTQFATEQILFSDHVAAPPSPAEIVRAARRDDVASIYQLYLRNTPSHVASAEGPTQKAWEAAFAQGIVAKLGRDDTRHLVAEHPGIYGWAAIRPPSGARPTVLSLMCDGHDPQARESFIDAVLAEVPSGPTTSVLRHYDSELIRALQQRGFEIYGTQLLLVRDLALKVRLRSPRARKKPVLVTAGVAQTKSLAASLQPNPLRVLSPVQANQEGRQ